MSRKSNLWCAIGALSQSPPRLVIDEFDADGIRDIGAKITPRRSREILWRKALKAGIERQVQGVVNDSETHDTCSKNARFSIAHDRHFATVAMSYGDGIGIDLQSDHPLESCYRIAETWFPELEAKEILESENCTRFLQSWVIKEAWAKCLSQSIFDACQSIFIWHGKVHIDNKISSPSDIKFAWARRCVGTQNQLLQIPKIKYDDKHSQFEVPGFAMGICIKEKALKSPEIICLIPGGDSQFCEFKIDWEWLPAISQV